ncbi:MAG TPA: hypothetical protein HPP94_00830 [Desulfuromonadales bacterium]|nr:hypothetical protein [Desulfuromonadales bacterium]
MRSLSVKRILKIAAGGGCVMLALLLIGVISVPALVSCRAAQTKIQQTLSRSMSRPVSWSGLTVSWLHGLTLSGLKLGDGPPPLLNAAIDSIDIVPGFSRGTDGRLGIDLAVNVRNIMTELAPGPQKPPPPTKDPLTLLAESIQRVQKLDLPLPVDLRVSLEVAPLQLKYRATAPAKSMRLQDFSLRLSMPSLATRPVTAVVNGRLFIAQKELGKIAFSAEIRDLVTPQKRIQLASALFAVDAATPGAGMTISGGLSQPDGFRSRLKLELPVLREMAQPFVPAGTPQLSGNMDLQLLSQIDTKRDLLAALTLAGSGLAARGGALKTKQVGPLDLKLQQQLASNHVTQRVDFPKGTFSVAGLLDAAWSAAVERPSAKNRSLELLFGPLRLDLARTVALAAPFLPPDLPLKDLAGEARLRSLQLKLSGPAYNGSVTVADLGITLPHLRLALKKGELSAQQVAVTLEKVTCPLVTKKPTGITGSLLWSIGRAALAGSQPLALEGARGTLGVNVNELNLKSASPRKITAAADVTHTCDVDRASLGTQLVIEKAHQQLHLLARAAETGGIEASLPELIVSAASLQASQGGKKLKPLPLNASLTAENFHLPYGTAALPSLRRAGATLTAGDFIRLSAEATLSGSAPQRATSTGSAQLDLQRALLFAAPFVPAGLKADGRVSALWNAAAPLPLTVPGAEKHPLKRAKAGLALLESLEMALKLDNVSATFPSTTGAVTLSGLQTKPDLRIVAAKNGQSVSFDGGLLFSGVNGLPNAMGKLPAQHGSLLVAGELSGWNEFHLTESFRMLPLSVSQELDLSVSRIETLFDEKAPFNTATLLKRLDATLFATCDGAFSSDMKQLLPGIDVAGSVSGSARMDVSASRELALRTALTSHEFGLQLANGTQIEGVSSNISINRDYDLAARPGERWTPLSASLVRPAAAADGNSGAADIITRITEDLRGNLHGARSFSIRRVTVSMPSGVPLVLTSLEGDLLFTREKTGLSFLQADLLGGTILARALFDQQPDVPLLAIGSSFSNLDVTHLLPHDIKKRQTPRDAEITGEITLTAPLMPEQRELSEQLRLNLNLRRIGADTLERALFTLDPFERNEQVVAQRNMLRLGTLKGLRATAVDGSFGMEGELLVKGVAINLPRVERLRISELPLRQELSKNRAAIMAVRRLIDQLRADTLLVGSHGKLTLQRRTYEK